MSFLVPKVFEVCCYAEIAAPHEGDHGLEIVALLAGHADLTVLELALHLEVLAFDGVDDFLRLVPFETLLNLQLLPGMPERRDGGIDLLDISQIDAAFAQFADDDFAQAA